MVPGPYITLDRSAEMYAWKETSSSKEVKDTVGGGSTTTTTYTYSKEWTSSPATSSSFEHPEGHDNPTKSIDDAAYKVSAATIGAYTINPATIELPGGDKVDVKPADGIQGFFKNGRYLYNRDGANSAPQVGDMRVSFTALKSGVSVTALGKLNAGAIESYTDESFTEGQRTLYRVFLGTRDDAIATLHFEYVLWIWVFRILGILGLWIGLGLLVDPIVKLLDVVGVIGSVADGIMGFVNFFVALAVGGTTIIIGMLFHNIYFLILIIALIIAGVVYYLRTHSIKALASGLIPSAATPAASDSNNTPPKMT
jgi:Transmembrane protein 43